MISTLELNPFHLAEESVWPLLVAVTAFNFLSSFVFFFWGSTFMYPMVNLSIFFILMYLWGKDVSTEGDLGGFHTSEVETSLKWSMGWFITSEIFFFISFFWGFFTFSLSNTIESGNTWPPLFITPLETFSVPLLNTLILVSSGISLTWGHHSLIEGDWNSGVQGFAITILLGIYFTMLQAGEYLESTFSFNDSIYGSIFFIATGFHGFHVIIGTSLLAMCLSRFFFQSNLSNHHMGVEVSSWYWHFVDVVWLFLFIVIYWWGS